MYQTPTVDPIIARLRPRSVQEIIDGAFRLYRAHFLTLLSITAIIFIPVQVVAQLLNAAVQGNTQSLQRSSLAAGESTDPSTLNAAFASILVLYGFVLLVSVLGRLLQYLSEGALTSAVADSYLDRPVAFGRAYRNMLSHIGPLLGLIVLQILIIVATFIPPILVFGLSFGVLLGSSVGDSGGAAGAGIAMCFLGLPLTMLSFVLYLFVSIRLQVVVPALIVENLGPVQAIKRSWGLVQNYWWRTFGLAALIYVFNLIVSAGPAAVVLALLTVFTRSLDLVTNTIISGFITVILSSLFIPLQLTSITMYYFDLRVRKEGFDLDQALTRLYSPPAPGQPGQPGTYNGYPVPGAAPAGAYGAPVPALGYGPAQPYPAQQGGTPTVAYPSYSPFPQQPQQPQYAPGYSQPAQGTAEQSALYTLPAQDAAGLSTSNGPSTAPLAGTFVPPAFGTPPIAEQATQHPSTSDTVQPGESARTQGSTITGPLPG